MEIIGVIIEANPFHNGHKYLLDYIKSKYTDSYVIGVTSTSFTMRGEISLINKFDKIKVLLDNSIDIVTELPIRYTLQSANYFALNTVKILNTYKVNKIICGCEVADTNYFNIFDQIFASSEFIKEYLDIKSLHLSMKKTYIEALSRLNISNDLISLFSSPNFTLAYLYHKAIIDNNYNIQVELIKRTNSYDELTTLHNSIASAKTIRELIKKGNSVQTFVPCKMDLIDINLSYDKLFLLAKYKFEILKATSFKDEEGIINYIKKEISKYNSFDSFIESIANKNYSKSRIRRVLLLVLLDIFDMSNTILYSRILGFTKRGLEYFEKMDRIEKKNYFSSIKELSDGDFRIPLIDEEIRSTKLYSLLTNNVNSFREYQLPIKLTTMKEGIK